MTTYPFELTPLECIYLSDAFSMFTPGPPGTGEHAAFPDLLLKVLSALSEADRDGATTVVHMSQAELWMIREVAKSSVTVGTEKVGLNLLMKAAKGLLALVADPELEGLVIRFGETDRQEPGKANYGDELQKLRSSTERGGNLDAGDNQDAHKDQPDDSAGD